MLQYLNIKAINKKNKKTMKTININKILFLAIFFVMTLHLEAMNSIVRYDNPQNTSGSFSLLASDCTTLGWSYYFEITVPADVLIKIDYNIGANVYVHIWSDLGDLIQGYGPYSGTGSILSGFDGKIGISISGIGSSPYIFNFKFAAGSYSAIQDSYIHGNSIVDGSVGIGTLIPKGNLDVEGTGYFNNNNVHRSTNLTINNSTQCQTGNIGINSNIYNPSAPVYGIYSNVSGGGSLNQRWAGYFSGGDLEVSGGNFKVSGNSKLTGNVGIGTTTTPLTILQIVKSDATTNQNLSNSAALDIWNSNSGINTGGQINFRSDANSGPAGIGAVIGYKNIGSTSAGSLGNLVFGVKNAATDGLVIPAMTIQYGGNVGIGTISPLAKLEVISNKANSSVIQYKSSTGGLLGKIWETGDNSSLLSLADNTGSENIILASEGVSYFKNAIKIGTSGIDLTGAMLTVNGIIHAKEVDVDVNIPADYVFKSDYKLMPLNEVEKYVKINSHLPEIPSAEEITKDGLKMGEMQNKLLQKVEELTLYMIEQQKTINQQSAKIEELEKKLK